MKLTDLRAILQCVPQFREKTFIIAVDAGIVTDENFANILLDIALLRSLNIRNLSKPFFPFGDEITPTLLTWRVGWNFVCNTALRGLAPDANIHMKLP